MIRSAFSVCCMTALLFISSCKKDNSEDEQLPALGTCESVSVSGHLSYFNISDTYQYHTSGGGTIFIHPDQYIKIEHDSYPDFFIDLWGTTVISGKTITTAQYESLNGQPVKDRKNARRSIVFPDGAKFTLISDSLVGAINSMDIIDGDECHHINFKCTTLEFSSAASSVLAQKLDESVPDGETGTFEFTSTGLLFVNIYTENVAGNKLNARVPIAEIFKANPNQVIDYWP